MRANSVGDRAINQLMFAQISGAFEEGRMVLKAQHKVIARHGDSWAVTLGADAGVVEARRYLDRMIDAEQGAIAGTGRPRPSSGDV